VRKRGRTTRLTYGVVDSVSLTLNVDYGHDIGVRTLTGQLGVRPDPARSPTFSAKGDSGSVLIGEAREVVGLLFAGDDTGYGVANPIAEVLSALDISVATGPAPSGWRCSPAARLSPSSRIGSAARNGSRTRPSSRKTRPEDEAKEDKDLKNEAKEDKDTKDEQKEIKDKQEKDERKESKDELKEKQEKDEFKEKQEKDELKEKSEKDEAKEKSEKDEFKETKDEQKEIKEKQEKPERKEGKDERKEAKDEGKENKDLGDKDIRDHKEPEFLPRAPRPRSASRREGPAALRKELKEGKQSQGVQAGVQGQQGTTGQDGEGRAQGNQDEGKDTKDFQPDVKNNKLEGKTSSPRSRSRRTSGRGEGSEAGNQGSDREAGQGMGHPDPNQLRLPVERRIAALETAITRLNHFIGRALRPDLSHGALHQEPDVPTPRRRTSEWRGARALRAVRHLRPVAAAGLARRIDGPVDVITGPMLGDARTWEHRIRATSPRSRSRSAMTGGSPTSTRGPC